MNNIIVAVLSMVIVLFSSGKTGKPINAAEIKGTETVHESSVVTIKIEGLVFNPKEITVEPGTTIRWSNLDLSDHDVTSGTAVVGRKVRKMKKSKFPDGKFQSGTFGKGKTYEVVLGEKGEYMYFCNIHPFMQALIIVK